MLSRFAPPLSFKQVIEQYGYPVVSKENAQRIYQIRHLNPQCKTHKTRLGKGRHALPQCWRFLINAPFEISDKCCLVMKKRPFAKFDRENKMHGMVATMAGESSLRMQKFLQENCNAFNSPHPKSHPLYFWNENDIYEYIKEYNVEICSLYTEHNFTRTGCMFCMFGKHHSNYEEFNKIKELHPKIYDYMMNKLGIRKVIDFILSHI